MAGDERIDRFEEAVNMMASELEGWLETDESKSVGEADGSGEAKGHRSGRRIVEILGKNRDELTDADLDHMQTVAAYVNRHVAQRPEGDVAETPWRYSLMNWGHDPLKS